MSKTISFHSFMRGVGRSTLAANMAALLASDGYTVGLVDAALLAPSLQFLFGLSDGEAVPSLDTYLLGWCPIQQAVHDVTSRLGPNAKGRLLLIPASQDVGEIVRALRQAYDAEHLGTSLQTLTEQLKLDALLIDVNSGLNEEVLTWMSLADIVAIVFHLDKQDYQGTAVMAGVAGKLGVPRTTLIVNQVPHLFDLEQVQAQVEQTYGCEAAGIIPYADEMMALAGTGIFVRQYPDHPLTDRLRQMAVRLLN